MNSKKRIAIIGAGVAGCGAAWGLQTGSEHEITVFEAAELPGGHCATEEIDYDGSRLRVDTGFIVYNELNYPNLTRLFSHLDVETQEADMSFSVSGVDGATQWTSRPADFFGGRLPITLKVPSPVHLRVLDDLLRFNRSGVADLHAGRLVGLTLGEYLDRGRFSRRFRDDYLLAMGTAIWSMPPGGVLDFPADAFLRFFENHRLLRISRPSWRTVTGGSRNYVSKLAATFSNRLRLGVRVVSVHPAADGAVVTLGNGERETFDAVVMACHSDQAKAILTDIDEAQRRLLDAIPYRDNVVYLHRDASLMPSRRSAWAAWNVLKRADGDVSVSYWMNALQGVDPARPLFVTLNPSQPPREELTFGRYRYSHPQFDRGALAAQARLPAIQGRAGVWFCGAWTGYGFHEDGLLSGLLVAESLGARLPWTPAPRLLLEAAE